MPDPTFEISPSATPLPTLSAPSPVNAGPKQLQALGAATQSAGRAVADIYTDALHEFNTTRTLEALTALQRKATDLRSGADGYLRKKGKDAMQRPDGRSLGQEYTDLLDAEAKSIAEGLGNSAQREAFTRQAAGITTGFKADVDNYALKENDAYQIDVHKAMADAGATVVGQSHGSPTEIAKGRGMVYAAADRLGELQGWQEGDGQRGLFLRAALSNSHLSLVSEMAAKGEYAQVEKYLADHKDEMTDEAYSNAYEVATKGQSLNLGSTKGRAIANGELGTGSGVGKQDVWYPIAGLWTPTGLFGAPRSGGTRSHAGLDMAVPRGTPVQAGADAVVRYHNSDPKGYGIAVDVVLDDGTVLRAAHLSSIDVPDGTRVRKGQVIARSGDSGNAKGHPHVHHEVIVKGRHVDPQAWYNGKPSVSSRGSTPSLKAAEDAVYNDPDLANNPTAREEALRVVRNTFSAFEHDRSQREQDAVDAGYRAATTKPGSVTAETLVNAGVPGRAIPGILATQEATAGRAQGAAVDPDKEFRAKLDIYNGLASGALRRVEDLLPYQPYLSKHDFDALVVDVTQTKWKQAGAAGNYTDIKRSLDDYGALGGYGAMFATKDGKQDDAKYAAFTGTVVRLIAEEEKAAGRPVSDERRRELIAGYMATIALSKRADGAYDARLGPGVYGRIPGGGREVLRAGLAGPNRQRVSAVSVQVEWDNTPQTLRQIPRDDYSKIFYTLKARLGRTPKQYEIVAEWRYQGGGR